MTKIKQREINGMEIAVIGMSCRFPGARNTAEYWDNLTRGVESISIFFDEELEKAGVDRQKMEAANYVKVGAIIEDIEYFDASFFGYTPRDSQFMDPQIRLIHECAWEALEDAGYDPASYSGSIGVYAGASDNISWKGSVMLAELTEQEGFSAQLLSNNYNLCTWLSYALNLKGPSVLTYSACSTSLLAIHMGCRALLGGECHIAIAGGVYAFFPQEIGYFFQEGMIFSRDGHTRSFDARATGSFLGGGIGLVILKPFEDAISEGDYIYAVIKGSAINSDGNRRVGFTAPSVSGQAEVINAALRMAEVEPESISYIEAHGTATSLGDPIEIKALKRVFNFKTNRGKNCAIGTVKSNFGHLNTAAGAAGFIKTVLALKHKLIPPSLHYENPNPEIDFENSPFYVNTKLTQWKNEKYPLRAGVSAFGMGGTNAHVILEEADYPIKFPVNKTTRDWHLITFSAKTETALDKLTENFAIYLEKNPRVNLADAAYTLQIGRRIFSYRRMVVCSDINEAISLLTSPDSRKVQTFYCKDEPYIIFMLSGLGGQYVNMGRELYQKEPVFRREMDRCFEILESLGYDIKEILYPDGSLSKASGGKWEDGKIGKDTHHSSIIIHNFEVAQLIVFIFEYSLARTLMEWGIKPQAMIGYSFGEYAAACLSGVFPLEGALKLIVTRGQLVMELPEGRMISVPLPREELESFINADISISIDNGPSCIVSGEPDAVAALEKKMKENRIVCMPLPQASRAIHSKMMEPILTVFRDKVAEIEPNSPQIPYISNVTGTWITEAEARNPEYWSRHLRVTVRFAEGIKQLVKEPNGIFVEIGPGRDISTLVQRYTEDKPDLRVLNLVRQPNKEIPDLYFLLNKIGFFWLYGNKIDWKKFHSHEKLLRIPLPTYPFERKPCPAEGNLLNVGTGVREKPPLQGKKDIPDWFYIPSWKPSLLPGIQPGEDLAPGTWLVFIDRCGLGEQLVKQLEQESQQVIIVQKGATYKKEDERRYTVNPGESSDYRALLEELQAREIVPRQIVHLWSVMHRESHESMEDWVKKCQESGYYSLIFLTHAIENRKSKDEIYITMLTNGMQGIYQEELLYPGKATLLGPVHIIPQEYSDLKCRVIDVVPAEPGSWKSKLLINQLLKELRTSSSDTVIVYRGGNRLVRAYEPVKLDKSTGKSLSPGLREGGVYLVTGGLGAIGLLLAKYLAHRVKTKLILTGRSPFPPRDQWKHWLDTHPRDESTAIKIKKLLEVENAGSEVLVLSADVSKREQIEEAIAQAENRFGPVNGVIHAALQVDGGIVHSITPAMTENVFAAKVRGTMILYDIFKKNQLDFFILFSSMSSILMQVGQVAYGAASAFLDAFSLSKAHGSGLPVTSIDWDSWQEVGGAVELAKDYAKSLGLSESQAKIEDGILSQEGLDAFDRILENPVPQVIVSPRDLIHRLDIHKESIMQNSLETMTTSKKKSPRLKLQTEYVAPKNDTEQTLADIWCEFFGFEQLGIRDDFFELGGDSLKAIVIASLIYKQMNVNVSISTIFNKPTIEELALDIEGDTGKSDYSYIMPAEAKEYYALSSAQKRFYFIYLLEPENTAYNVPALMVLEGALDRERWKETFRELIHRHESLRTSFTVIDEEPVQRIHKVVNTSFQYDDLKAPAVGNSLPVVNDKSGVEKIIRDFIRPFDLSRAPLLRVGLIKTGETRYILMIDIHHIVTDGISHEVLTEDFMVLYAGKVLPPLKLQYRDFSQWQNLMFESGKIRDQEKYWLQRFNGPIPVLHMPADYPRPSMRCVDEGDYIKFQVKEPLAPKIFDLLKKTDTTFYMVLMAVYNILLFKYTKDEDIVVGTPVAGRNHADLQNIIGLFINMLPMRNHPTGDKTFTQFLEEVKKNALEAYQNQDYPFDQLVNKLGLQGETSRNPLFDTEFAVINFEIAGVDLQDLKLEPYPGGFKFAKFDLHFMAIETGDTINFTVRYYTALFNRSTVEKIVEHYLEILEQVMENLEIKLKDIAISLDFLEVSSNILDEVKGEFEL